MPAFLFSLREPRYWWVVATLFLLACGTTFYVYFYPHYIAAATCLFVLISVKGLENLSRLTVRGIPVGREAARLILALCLAHFVFWVWHLCMGRYQRPRGRGTLRAPVRDCERRSGRPPRHRRQAQSYAGATTGVRPLYSRTQRRPVDPQCG